jgi:hypothetical protein
MGSENALIQSKSPILCVNIQHVSGLQIVDIGCQKFDSEN